MALPRRLEEEWLDSLPADDPQAIGSRRDLRLVNGLMLNVRMAAHAIDAHVTRPPRRILEIGAGDGTWMLALARRLARPGTGLHITLLDRQDLVGRQTRDGFAGLECEFESVTGDVFACFASGKLSSYDLILANLFLHHFAFEDLSRLFVMLARSTRLFIACEPRRARMPLLMSRLLGTLGCNATTRHDAVVSVRAGFRDDELSRCWPRGEEWRLEEYAAWPFSHCFVAGHG